MSLIAVLVAACDGGTGSGRPGSPQERRQAPQELQRKVGEGEQCLVCGELIHGGQVVELRYKGRTFHVASQLLDDLFAEPDRYFHKLQARSALFDEEAYASTTPSNAWLYLGLYVLAGLVFGALCGYLAITRSMRALPWFFAGLLGNAAALVVLLAAGRRGTARFGVPPGLAKVPSTSAPVACAACGRGNHPAARACARCGASLEPTVPSEVARLRGRGAP